MDSARCQLLLLYELELAIRSAATFAYGDRLCRRHLDGARRNSGPAKSVSGAEPRRKPRMIPDVEVNAKPSPEK